MLSRALLPCLLLQGLLSAQSENVPVYQPTSTPLSIGGRDTRAIVPGDLDGDGDLDVFVANFAQDNILYENVGAGVFEHAPTQLMTTDGGFSFDAAFGDADGDGDLDVAVANGHETDNTMYLNLGRLHFQKVKAGPAVKSGGESYAVAWGDVDGDGDLDLAYANKLEPNFLYLNNGKARFHPVNKPPIGKDDRTSRDVTFADLDGDGDLEMLIGNSNDQRNDVYVNQGGAQGGKEGDFVGATEGPLATDEARTRGMSVADFDADGDLDVMVTNHEDQQNMLYRNLGDLAFERAEELAPSQDFGDSYTSAWGDLDADGDLDLVVANREQPAFAYLNTGGAFQKLTAGPLVTEPSNARNVVIADCDGDGMGEIMISNSMGEGNALYVHVGASWEDIGWMDGASVEPGKKPVPRPVLAGIGEAAPGRTITFRLENAAADASAWIVAGGSRADQPLLGMLLVPSPEVILPARLGSDGTLELSARVPREMVSGTVLYLQAFVADPRGREGFTASNGLRLLVP